MIAGVIINTSFSLSLTYGRIIPSHKIIVINVPVPVLLRDTANEQVQDRRLHIVLNDPFHLDVIEFLRLDYHVRIQVLVLVLAAPLRLATLSWHIPKGDVEILIKGQGGKGLRHFNLCTFLSVSWDICWYVAHHRPQRQQRRRCRFLCIHISGI